MAKREVKYKSNFFLELSHKFERVNERKYYFYFLWRNKLSNSQTDFSEMSEDEFIDKYLKRTVKGKQGDGKRSYKMLQLWETTDEYQALKQELYEIRMNEDWYKLYDTYLEKAMSGDEKAVNALKTIKKEIESLNKVSKTKIKKASDDDEDFDLE